MIIYHGYLLLINKLYILGIFAF